MLDSILSYLRRNPNPAQAEQLELRTPLEHFFGSVDVASRWIINVAVVSGMNEDVNVRDTS
jgi:hypothetical protein